MKRYRIIKEFFVEANNEFEAERKANYKEIDSFIQSKLIDVQELQEVKEEKWTVKTVEAIIFILWLG